ncbi:MAG: hypothetical protein AVDCRST_MAG67-2519, partial [uncultured Solirubrobacteraceae bacterium]
CTSARSTSTRTGRHAAARRRSTSSCRAPPGPRWRSRSTPWRSCWSCSSRRSAARAGRSARTAAPRSRSSIRLCARAHGPRRL